MVRLSEFPHRYSPPPLPPSTERDVRTTMSAYHDGSTSSHPYTEPSPLPSSIPKVDELGTTSAPLKSAAFFIGAYCKDYNGSSRGTKPQTCADFIGAERRNFQRTLCFARLRTVTRVTVSRKAVESPGVLRICTSD
jgi:hypothetical protein